MTVQLRYVFAGTPAKYAAVMWQIAKKLGDQLRVEPTTFCFHVLPPPKLVSPSEYLIPEISPETTEVRTQFTAELFWEKIPLTYDERVWNAWQAGEPMPEKQQPEPDIDSMTLEELLAEQATWTEDDLLESMGDIYAKVIVEEMPNGESLFTVESEDGDWPRLQSVWKLISDELLTRKYLRTIDSPAGSAVKSESDSSSLNPTTPPKKPPNRYAQKRRPRVKQLFYEGYSAERISEMLEAQGYEVCTLPTVKRDLKALGLTTPRARSKRPSKKSKTPR